MPDDLLLIRHQIRAAFPPTRFQGAVTLCPCDECKELQETMQGKSWDQITNDFVDFTGSPTLLTPDAFQAFLPAYMLRALDNIATDNVVLEFTVYSLCPSIALDDEVPDPDPLKDPKHSQRLRDLARLMSPAQIAAIRCFLSFIADQASQRKWFRPLVLASLETIWR